MENSNAVILARVSSKSQEDEGYSLESQLKLLEGYCSRNNLNVIKVFKIAETASKEHSRKIFREMLVYISKNRIYHLAIEKTDRFTRNFKDAVAIDDWLDGDEDRRLHAVKENLILHKYAKSDTKFMWNIYVSVAKKYSDNLREEAMKGWAEKLAQGWLPASPPPGYKTVVENGKKIHIPDPATSYMIQNAFRKFLEPGESSVTITDYLAESGLKTSKGHPYNKSKVYDILNNPFYVGINRFNGKDFPGAQEPIISKDIFEAAQAKLHGKRPKTFNKHFTAFKGLIKCENCHSSITWQLQKGRYYGVCKRSNEVCRRGKMLREDKIEEEVLKQLEILVCPIPEIVDWAIETIRSDYKNEVENSEALTKSIKAQIEKLERMDETLYDDKLSGEINKERYEVKHEKFMQDKQQLIERLGKVRTSHASVIESKLALVELSQKAAQIYKKKSAEQKRFIMSKLFESITLKDNILSVKYTKLSEIIAEKVQETYKLMEV